MDQPVREFLNSCPIPVVSESGSGPGPGPVPGHGPSPGPSGLQNPVPVPVPLPVPVPVPTTAATVAATTNSNRILSRNVNGTSKCCTLHGKAVLACKMCKMHACLPAWEETALKPVAN